MKTDVIPGDTGLLASVTQMESRPYFLSKRGNNSPGPLPGPGMCLQSGARCLKGGVLLGSLRFSVCNLSRWVVGPSHSVCIHLVVPPPHPPHFVQRDMRDQVLLTE